MNNRLKTIVFVFLIYTGFEILAYKFPPFKDYTAIFRPVIWAFIGALFGGYITHLFHLERSNKEKMEKTRRLAQAISNELSALWDRYMDISGKSLERDADGRDFSLEVGLNDSNRDYFTVFDSSASDLGLLPKDISHTLIRLYIDFKAFFTELNIYSHVLSEYENVRRQPLLFDEKVKLGKNLKDHFSYLKEGHDRLKENVKRTRSELERIS